MELIDKDTLLSEIEKRMQELNPTDTHKMQTGERMSTEVLMWLNALTWVKKTINSLKTKEVDLKKEINDIFPFGESRYVTDKNYNQSNKYND